MTEKIEAATQALNSAKETLANATGVATDAAKAGVKAVANSDLVAAAGTMATSAASEIGKAASSLAQAGSKWAYIWMVQRMAQQVLTTVVDIIIVIAIVYIAVFFMRLFVNKIQQMWESKGFIDQVSNNIKHQISLDNTKLLEDVSRHKDGIHEKVVILTNKVNQFAEIQEKYSFEPLKKQLHEVLQEYKTALFSFEQRIQRLEALVKDKGAQKDR